jgi:hypothetical protein
MFRFVALTSKSKGQTDRKKNKNNVLPDIGIEAQKINKMVTIDVGRSVHHHTIQTN